MGANIILHYRTNAEEAEVVEREVLKQGVKVWKYAADLSELEQIKNLLDRIAEAHPQIDIFVANAAATAFKPLIDIREHHIQKTMNITITTFILAMNRFKALMKPGAKVITVSGIDTEKYCFNHGLLAAAKAALETLTKYYAQEWAADQIFVHGINPGIVDTDSMKVYFGPHYEATIQQMKKMIPTGNLLSCDEVAEMIAFLCSPTANHMTGQTMLADGGLAFKMPLFSTPK